MASASMPSLEDDHALRATVPAVEQALGYRFHNRHLLLTALTHRSFCHEANTSSGDFDELEWLGDSVLQLAISSWLFNSAKGSRRSSGQLSLTRQRFVDAGACESFALQLNLLPSLRIGNGQPVKGTKILADCFEAVLGAVYVDAGGCSDLEPVHAILGRVIPSYDHGRRSHRKSQQQQQQHHEPHRHHPHHHPHHHHHPHQHQHQQHHLHRPTVHGAMEIQRARVDEPRKLMNLVHRLTQMAKRPKMEDGQGHGPVMEGSNVPHVPRDPAEVLRDFEGRLTAFHKVFLRSGALSFSTDAFAKAFGESVARFYETAANDPERRGLLDSVLAGTSMLRKHFIDAPQGAERVVMEVVPVPSEVRLQCFAAVECILADIFYQEGEPGQRVLQLIESATAPTPHGQGIVALLSSVVTESATNLLLTAHQRAVISAGLAREPSLFAAVTATTAAPDPAHDHPRPESHSSPPPPPPRSSSSASSPHGSPGVPHRHRGSPRRADCMFAPGRGVGARPHGRTWRADGDRGGPGWKGRGWGRGRGRGGGM